MNLRSNSTESLIVRNLIVFAVYFAAARFGLGFEPVSGFASLIWPPTGIALVALLLYGYKLWPGLLAGACLANFVQGAPYLVALGIGSGNALEAVVGAYLLRRVQFRNSLERLRDVIWFIIFGGLLSTMVSATIGVSSLWLGGVINFSAYGSTWLPWWLGDMMGGLIVAPFLLIWITSPAIKLKLFSWLRLVELLALALTIVVPPLLLFGGWRFGKHRELPVAYLIFIPVIWSSLRFRQRGAVTSTLIMSIGAIWGTIHGYGPFVSWSLSTNLLFLQMFMGVVAATSLILAGGESEIEEKEEEIEIAAEQLSEKVTELEDRKRELTKAVEGLNLEKAKLEEAVAKERATIEAIGDGLVVANRNGRIVMVNKAFEEILGWKEMEVVGKDMVSIIPSEDKDGNLIPNKGRMMSKILSGEIKTTTSVSDWYYIRKDKTKIHVSLNINPIYFNGQIIGAVETFREIKK